MSWIRAEIQRINDRQRADFLITQRDIGQSGYSITQPGVYQLAEDIEFNPTATFSPELLQRFRQELLPSPYREEAIIQPHGQQQILSVPRRSLLSYCTSFECSLQDLHVLKDVQCSICYCELGELNITITTLPCLHQYHQKCIESWFQHKNTCPLCRYQVGEPEVI
jgi:hypothetical protein